LERREDCVLEFGLRRSLCACGALPDFSACCCTLEGVGGAGGLADREPPSARRRCNKEPCLPHCAGPSEPRTAAGTGGVCIAYNKMVARLLAAGTVSTTSEAGALTRTCAALASSEKAGKKASNIDMMYP